MDCGALMSIVYCVRQLWHAKEELESVLCGAQNALYPLMHLKTVFISGLLYVTAATRSLWVVCAVHFKPKWIGSAQN